MSVVSLATDRLVSHLDHGECYAENYAEEDFGQARSAVYEAAHSLIAVTSHVNVSGPEYQDRKDAYALLRAQLRNPRLAALATSLGLDRVQL